MRKYIAYLTYIKQPDKRTAYSPFDIFDLLQQRQYFMGNKFPTLAYL